MRLLAHERAVWCSNVLRLIQCVTTLTLLSLLKCLYAQSDAPIIAPPLGRIQSSATSPAVSADTPSDLAATQALQNVISRSGGRSAWSAMHIVKCRYRIVGTTGRHPDLLMLDDWTTTIVRYRRGEAGSGRQPRDHDGNPSLRSPSDPTSPKIPEFDQARVLADHLPAAAASTIIGSGSYIVKSIPQTLCIPANTCLAVYRRLHERMALKEQEWTISDSTGLPTSILLRLPSVSMNPPQGTIVPASPMHHPLTWERVRFDTYDIQGDVTVPGLIAISFPGGSGQLRKLVSARASQVFDKAAFDAEVLR